MAQIINKPIPSNQKIFLNIKVELDDYIIRLRDELKELKKFREALKQWSNELSKLLDPRSSVFDKVRGVDRELEKIIDDYDLKLKHAIINKIVEITKEKIEKLGDEQR